MFTRRGAILDQASVMRLPSGLLPVVLTCVSLWVCLASVSAQDTPPAVPDPAAKTGPPTADKSAKPRPDDAETNPSTSEAWRSEMQELEQLTLQEQAGNGPKKGPSGWSMGFWLAFIVALAGGALWGILKYRRRLSGGPELDDMKIISRRAIDPRNSVVILRTRGRDYLLGLGPSGVSLLTMLPAATPPNPGAGHDDPKPEGNEPKPPVSVR